MACFFRNIARTKSFASQLYFELHGRIVQSLGICIADYETNIMNSGLVHVVYGIAAAARARARPMPDVEPEMTAT